MKVFKQRNIKRSHFRWKEFRLEILYEYMKDFRKFKRLLKTIIVGGILGFAYFLYSNKDTLL